MVTRVSTYKKRQVYCILIHTVSSDALVFQPSVEITACDSDSNLLESQVAPSPAFLDFVHSRGIYVIQTGFVFQSHERIRDGWSKNNGYFRIFDIY
jgi:hypothetical protein